MRWEYVLPLFGVSKSRYFNTTVTLEQLFCVAETAQFFCYGTLIVFLTFKIFLALVSSKYSVHHCMWLFRVIVDKIAVHIVISLNLSTECASRDTVCCTGFKTA